MRTKLVPRTALMAGLVLALVGAAALPAPAAQVPVHLDFYGAGSLTVRDVVMPIPNDPANPGACDGGPHSYLAPDWDPDLNPNVIDLDVPDYHLAAGTMTIAGIDRRIQINGHHDTLGTVTAAGNVMLPLDVQIVVQTCAGAPTLCVMNHVLVTLTNPANGYTGARPPADDDPIDDLQGASPAIANFVFPCNAVIRAFFMGQPATFDVNLCAQDDPAAFPHADGC